MPQNLEPVDPRARAFPTSWRDAAIRALFDSTIGGVVCPICQIEFRGMRQLKMLHADHIKPWSKGGMTIWENLQLLCGSCNIRKYNHLSGT